MNRWWILVFLGIVWSCTSAVDQQKKKTIDTYYDINGLIDYQVFLLDSIRPFLLKTGSINGKMAWDTIPPEKADWASELMVFRSTDINKSMLISSYNVVGKNISGLPTTIYVSKSPKATFADSIALQFTSQGKQPFKFYATLNTKNVLFKSNKYVAMTFDTTGQKSLLKSMKVEGWQKMVLEDSTAFSISSKVAYR